MSDFNPDEYLKSSSSGFDPDAYLAHEQTPAEKYAEPGLINVSMTPVTGPSLNKQGTDIAESSFGQRHPLLGAAAGTIVSKLPDFLAAASGISDAPVLAKLAEKGIAKVGGYLADRAALRSPALPVTEVPLPRVIMNEAPPAPTLKLDPLPAAGDVKGTAAKAASELQAKLAALKDSARSNYSGGLKKLGIEMDQPTLAIRKPEQIQTAFNELKQGATPKVTPAVARDPEMEKIFGTPKPEPTITPAVQPTERFKQLWQLDKELSQNIKFAEPASQRGLFQLQNQIRSEMDLLPESKIMNPLRDEYSRYKHLTKDLGKPLQDVNQQAPLLARMATNGFKDVAPVGDAAKANALAKFEGETGSKILDPVRAEVAKNKAMEAVQSRNDAISKAFTKEDRVRQAQAIRDQRESTQLTKAAAAKEEGDQALFARMQAEEKAAADKVAAEKVESRKALIKKVLYGGAGAVGIKYGHKFL